MAEIGNGLIPIQYEISSAFRNFSGFGAGTVDTPFEGPTGKSDFAQPVHDNQRPDGQEEEVNLSGERVSLLGALDVEDEANVAAQDPAVWAHDAKADVALVKPMPTTTALTPSKKRAADRNVAQLEFAATGIFGDRPVQLAGQMGWFDHLRNMSANASRKFIFP
ncbi:hypothetical protein E6O75_ATG03603 [Venturia nashicola]|uniref:Uncharacterized protein n=1 Tax=Venturia nashicola TaxID=86259 RepID=A0A4Z1PPB1_9PEZI|nr:hypothetical protein E6O75_ATG03603 [Venturia nashicola]